MIIKFSDIKLSDETYIMVYDKILDASKKCITQFKENKGKKEYFDKLRNLFQDILTLKLSLVKIYKDTKIKEDLMLIILLTDLNIMINNTWQKVFNNFDMNRQEEMNSMIKSNTEGIFKNLKIIY